MNTQYIIYKQRPLFYVIVKPSFKKVDVYVEMNSHKLPGGRICSSLSAARNRNAADSR